MLRSSPTQEFIYFKKIQKGKAATMISSMPLVRNLQFYRKSALHRNIQLQQADAASPQPTGKDGVLELFSKNNDIPTSIWQDVVWELNLNNRGNGGDVCQFPENAPQHRRFNGYTRDQVTAAALLKASRYDGFSQEPGDGKPKSITLPLSNIKNNCVEVTPGRFGINPQPTQEQVDQAWNVLSWVAPHKPSPNGAPAEFNFTRDFLTAFGSYALTAASDVEYGIGQWGLPNHIKKGTGGQPDVVEVVKPKLTVAAGQRTDPKEQNWLAWTDRPEISTQTNVPVNPTITLSKKYIEQLVYADPDPTTWEAGEFGRKRIDLVSLMAHEFGHVLGLKDTVDSRLMSPSQPLASRQKPGEIDAKNLESLGYSWADHPETRPTGDGLVGLVVEPEPSPDGVGWAPPATYVQRVRR